jgi:MFS family permease
MKEKLWTQSFISACIANFMLFFAFYLLVPVFPLYLIEEYDSTNSMVGLVLSSYTIAALLFRPFAGFILDMFYRRPLYLLAYLLFISSFFSYPLANAIGMFLFFRILHGFSFGFVTTAGNSLIVDIMPASRRGEGLGYFGVANNLAMSVGPMTGLLMHEVFSFDIIFYTAIAVGFIGFVFALMIKSENLTDNRNKQPIAFDRFFLFKGFNAGVSLLLMGIPYGMLVTYIAIYAKEIGINGAVGLFFSIMAVGLIASRLVGGKMVDKGKTNAVIGWGTLICVLGYFILASLTFIDNTIIINIAFYSLALILGLGYGLIFPAYNALFVNLAPNNRRATASSTYMTSWDIGIGIGLITGGMIADKTGGFEFSYVAGSLAATISLIFFLRITAPHYLKHKLN